MTVFDRIETPLTPAELAENERLIAEWLALTDVLENRGLLWIEDQWINRPTTHVEYIPVEGPERKPTSGMIRMVPLLSPFGLDHVAALLRDDAEDPS